MPFDVMFYTDCPPARSVHGGTGFQFQAESDGVTSSDELFVQAAMLHSVAAPLVRSGAPLVEHPQTCKYAEHQGRFYLSRGRYDGDVGDGRQGNQLTACLVTSAPNDILPGRPAQLYSSPGWSLHASPTTTVPAWQTPLEIAPEFEITALHDMVRGASWARSVLPTFLTMVEQAVAPSRRSLIIIHSDLSEAMRWIALATLFLDAGTAMKTSFAGFVENPAADPAAIVATCPKLLTSPLVPADVPGKNVFDVVNHLTTDLTPSAVAVIQASWFLDGDPFCALDAIEVCRRWAGFMDPVVATQAAGLACMPDRSPDPSDLVCACTALERLARAEAEDDLEAYGDELVLAVASVGPTRGPFVTPILDALWCLQAAGEPELVAPLTLAALEWAAILPDQAWEWAQRFAAEPLGVRAQVRWPDDDNRRHAAELLDTVVASMPPERLPTVFAWAKALETGQSPDRIAPAIDALGRLWASDVSLGEAAPNWLHRSSVIIRLGAHLADRLADARDPVALAEWHAGGWDWLLVAPELAYESPLWPWLEARRVMNAPEDERLSLFEIAAPSSLSTDWPAFFNPTDTRPSARMLAAWIGTHPEPDDRFCEYLAGVVDHYQSDCPEVLPIILWAVPDTSAESYGDPICTLRSNLMRLDGLLIKAREQASSPKNDALRDAARVDPEYLACFPGAVAISLCECRDKRAVAELFTKAPRGTVEKVRKILLGSLLRGRSGGLAITLRLAVEAGVPRQLGRAAFQELDSFWREQNGTRLLKDLVSSLPRDANASLEKFEALRERGPALRTIRRSFGRATGKDGQHG